MIPRWFSILLLVIGWLFWGPSQAVTGQAPVGITDPGLQRQIGASWWTLGGYVGVGFDAFGAPYMNSGKHAPYDVGFSGWMLRLAVDPRVHPELGLEAGQAADVRQIVARLYKQLQQIQRGVENPESGAVDRQAWEQLPVAFRKASDDAFLQAAQLLSEEQQARLEQLVVRDWMRNVGWLHALNHSELKSYLSLTSDQQEAISKRAKQLLKELQQRIGDLEESVTDELLANLSAGKRKRISTLRDTFETPLPPEIDLLHWHVRRFADSVPGQAQDDAGQAGDDSINDQDMLRLGRKLETGQPSLSPRGLGTFQVFIDPYHRMPHADLVCDLLSNGKLQKELEMTRNQTSEIVRLRQAIRDVAKSSIKGLLIKQPNR